MGSSLEIWFLLRVCSNLIWVFFEMLFLIWVLSEMSVSHMGFPQFCVSIWDFLVYMTMTDFTHFNLDLNDSLLLIRDF